MIILLRTLSPFTASFDLHKNHCKQNCSGGNDAMPMADQYAHKFNLLSYIIMMVNKRIFPNSYRFPILPSVTNIFPYIMPIQQL